MPTLLASANTFPISDESGAVLVTISRWACASTQLTFSGSGRGAGSRSISRLCRSATS